MRIAVSQISSTTDPRSNLELVRDAVRRAEGARVVVLPEATMCRFGVPLGPVAEPLDGPWASAVHEIAVQHDVVVVAGMFTPSGDRVTNTLLVTGPDLHVGYDKIHLFDAFGFQESRTVAPGSSPVVFEVDGVTLGVATCYDIRFPELFRALADEGASAVLVGASWGAGPGKKEQWELLVRARALDCTSFVVACGQAFPGDLGSTAPTGIGYSTVADPFGNVVVQLSEQVSETVVDLDFDVVAKAREVLPVLANRRLTSS
ncbi:carbon-nitrogen hydrolase family protein [Lentzea sp. HUAS12]|uniref:carbon-nitrogen hydrolase family protein n=1 Tax=Lentzea sp. HUAS12 TaxID=2951806 RepID=UPI00209F2B3C|nr:carbon-nitrogen hydrolase family protein [Lentzea sp. HUAS12]USX51725.1 carbon-nitrogen hydrolase family protein [Lentzea sp. HUAS12]